MKDGDKGFLEEIRDKNVLVVGDIMLDHYTYGDVDRISPEAPIPVLRNTAEHSTLGGAANVAANAASLCAHVTLCGVVGVDHHAEEVRSLLKKNGIAADGITEDASRPTTFKHRFVAGAHHQMLRVDNEELHHLDPEIEAVFMANVLAHVQHADVIVLSDYAKGLFTRDIVEQILAAAKKRKIKVLADFKPKNKNVFVGVDVISPNLKEAKELSGLEEIEEVGWNLADHFSADVMLTRSHEGISVFLRNTRTHHHVPGKKIKVSDVSGAGDTVMAVVALAIACGMELIEAAMLANTAGSIVVQKPGTATLTFEELISATHFNNNVESTEIVPKLWGYEKWLENNEKYCSKLLSLNKGYQCSLHYHKVKDETFLVTSGHVRLEVEGEVYHLREGGFMRIPPGTRHRFTGIEDSLIIEVSTHHEESDSYRIEESRKVEV